VQCANSPSTLPPSLPGGRVMDGIHRVLWAAIGHLFPPHARALPASADSFAISWSMADDPHAKYEHAAPILIRLEDDLVEAMAKATHEQQKNIARRQEATVRAGMTGYDPYAAVPKTRVIVLG